VISLELDLAIYRRLTGAPLDRTGRPVLDPISKIPVNTYRILPPDHGGGTGPSYGIRIPMLKHPHDLGNYLTTQDQSALPLFKGFADTFRQVPVFNENIMGRGWPDVWPCVTFRWNDMDFNESVFMYSDPFEYDDTASDNIDIVNRNGDTIQQGYSANYVRPEPDSYKMTYAITARCKNIIELGLVSTQITYLFPARGSIEVEFASGEKHACDMLQKHIVTADDMKDNIMMSAGGEEQRSYARMFVYDIEAYVDNTVNRYGISDIMRNGTLIYHRILELQNMQTQLIKTVELNATEVANGP
jgi:hypothetical protein